MNWKLISMVALAALFAVAACKKKEEAKKEDKTAQTEKGGTAEPAAERPAAKDAWEAYAYRTIDCTKEMVGAEAWSPEAEAAAKQGADAVLEAMKGQGEASGEAAAKAMEACASASCDDFPICFATEFGKALTPVVAPPPDPPAGGETASADGPCGAYVTKSIELWKKEAGEMSAEAMEQVIAGGMRDGLATTCQTAGATLGEGFTGDAVAKANEACANETTLAGFQGCWMTKIVEVAVPGVAVPAP